MSYEVLAVIDECLERLEDSMWEFHAVETPVSPLGMSDADWHMALMHGRGEPCPDGCGGF